MPLRTKRKPGDHIIIKDRDGNIIADFRMEQEIDADSNKPRRTVACAIQVADGYVIEIKKPQP